MIYIISEALPLLIVFWINVKNINKVKEENTNSFVLQDPEEKKLQDESDEALRKVSDNISANADSDLDYRDRFKARERDNTIFEVPEFAQP